MDVIVNADYNGMRLDRFAFQRLNLPHSLIAKLVRKKDIKLNGSRAQINASLKEGDVLSVPDFLKLTPKEIKRGEGFVSSSAMEDFNKNILYECDDFFVLNKPSGLPTQGGSGIKLCVDEFLFALNPEFRLVHRIDKETSGCLIVAKNRLSASSIASDFQKKLIKKTYIAVTYGIPSNPCGTIELKLKSNVGGITCVDDQGKDSKTMFKVLETYEGKYAKMELDIETGRMHQIRVHLASIGSKIVGDAKYGDITSDFAKDIMPKMLLHALKIRYDGLEVVAPIPSYFLPPHFH